MTLTQGLVNKKISQSVGMKKVGITNDSLRLIAKE
jgi:hypothetical protein